MSYFISPVSIVPIVPLKQNNFFFNLFLLSRNFQEEEYNKLFRNNNKRWEQSGNISQISDKTKIAKQLILSHLAIIHRGPTWTNNTTTNSNIISTPGEVDYMWGSTDGSNTSTQPATSNGKATGSTHDGSVNIYMNHALALVSFRIYNDGTYKNTGKLTKIQLKNKNASGLSDGGAVKMNISTGAITTGSGAAGATYTRFIDNDGNGTPFGYTIISVATTPSATVATTEDDAKAASSKFSIMALPIAAGDKVAANTVQAIFTIDGADYDVVLGSSGNLTWERGKNHLYTVKLSGKGLSVGTVTVAAWGTGNGNDDLKVN